MNPIYSTLLHTIEAAIVLTIAILVSRFFPEHRETALLVIGAVVAALPKYLRVSDLPVSDYVNGEDKN
jgi:xanthine/uracil permease